MSSGSRTIEGVSNAAMGEEKTLTVCNVEEQLRRQLF